MPVPFSKETFVPLQGDEVMIVDDDDGVNDDRDGDSPSEGESIQCFTNYPCCPVCRHLGSAAVHAVPCATASNPAYTWPESLSHIGHARVEH